MKKFISFVLVLMMITALMVPVYAADATISVSGATGAPGQEVTVYVNISNNPGIYGANVSLSYDKNVMTLKSMTPGFLGTVNAGTGQANGAFSTPMSENGTLVSAVFVISDSAKNGSTTVSVSGTYRNADKAKVSYSSSSTVTVKIPECATHTWGEWTGSDATCTAAANKTRTCSVCGKVETDNTAALGHNWGAWTGTDATCTEAANKTRTCSRCGEVETDNTAALGHTPGEAVKENEKAATCTVEGSYDEVVYCSVCGEKISSTPKTIPALGHTPGEAVKENEKAATCTVEGSYDEVVYCSVCGEELSRETKTIPAAHTPAKAVRENEVKGDCKTKHSYDEVVYCSVCGEKLSSKHVVGELGGHNYGTDGKCTICGKVKDPNLDKQPDTGDIFVEIAMYASFAALAVGAVVFAKRKVRG